MKLLTACLLSIVLLLGSGCFPLTQMVKDRAEGYTRVDKKTKESESIPGNRAYYALTPLTIPPDIAVLPVAALVFGVWMAVGAPGATGH